jgi:phosphoribosylformylglycinamidine synthase
VLRIGVTDSEPALEVQDVFTATVAELRETSRATLPAAFGPTVTEPEASA